MDMKTITTTAARANISKLIKRVRETGEAVAIGVRNEPEVLLIRYPRYNPELSDITNFNAESGAFAFLADEPDLYTDKDLIRRYA
jgi:prevent-host-death family protein